MFLGGHVGGGLYSGACYLKIVPAKPMLAIDSGKTNLQLVLSFLQLSILEFNFEGFEVTDILNRLRSCNCGMLDGRGGPQAL